METIEDSAEKENFLSFQDLIPPLDPKIISILEKKLKFDKITKVQYHCIPLFEKKDICVKVSFNH
jgi:superfamily II DNA/RNA helicase